ncbi:MAG: hypothetical protein HXY35_16350 [Chloroflexi bacterium]|nr:hypothetical protein [Chloroflexota bacterium]
MDMQRLESLPPPPGVIGSLRAGFDAVSSHVVLILMPLALDVFLWLGPRLSVGEIYRSFLADWIRFRGGQDAQLLSGWVDVLAQFNLLNWLRTLPVGIPSLLSGILPDSLPMQTPLGVQSVIQVSSLPAMVGWLILLTLVGWAVGGLYFRWVSGTTLGEDEAGISPFRAIAQTFLLSVIWLVVLMVILVPVLLVVTVLALLNPVLANGAVLIFLIVSFWLVVPLFFTPHGIFVKRQNAFYSILSSLKMARFTLPASSMFVFAVFILSTGLNYLWMVPPSDSWMLLVGIAGHAFITTALLSASFVYYHDMNAWLQLVFNQLRQQKGVPTQQA